MSSPAKIIYVIVTSLFLVAFAIPLLGLAQKGGLEDFLTRVDEKLASLESLTASFEQTREIGLSDQKIEAKGRLYLRKPRRILLDYTEPERQKLIVNNSVVMIYIPSLKQVQRLDLEDSPQEQNLFAFWEPLSRLRERFTMAAVRRDRSRLRYIELVPRGDVYAEGLRKLILGIDPDLLLPRELEVEEVSGDVVKMVLSRIKIDVELDDSLFELKLGEEVEVIDYSQ